MSVRMQPINSTAATLTLDPEVHGETWLTQSLAATWTITLPASTGSGVTYNVYVGTTVTANAIIKVANSSDVMFGGVSVSTDAGGVTILTGSTDDTITMSGSTTGGLKGSWVTLQDVKANEWRVSGFLISTGAEATPFSATVT
jgi:hypothetical protein